MREKDYIKNGQTLPGPSSYNLKSPLTDGAPKATMPGRRKDLRPKSGTDAPGSGNYNPNYDPMRKSGPMFSI